MQMDQQKDYLQRTAKEMRFRVVFRGRDGKKSNVRKQKRPSLLLCSLCLGRQFLETRHFFIYSFLCYIDFLHFHLFIGFFIFTRLQVSARFIWELQVSSYLFKPIRIYNSLYDVCLFFFYCTWPLTLEVFRAGSEEVLFKETHKKTHSSFVYLLVKVIHSLDLSLLFLLESFHFKPV